MENEPADAGYSSGDRIWKKTPADDQQVAVAGRGFGDQLLMQDTHHVGDILGLYWDNGRAYGNYKDYEHRGYMSHSLNS